MKNCAKHTIKACAFIIALSTYACKAQKATNNNQVAARPEISVDIGNGQSKCDWPVVNATELTYSLYIISETGDYKAQPSIRLGAAKHPASDLTIIDYSVLSGRFFDTQKEFDSQVGTSAKSIDWKTQRVYILSTSKCYKHGKLESSNNLLGISLSKDKSKVIIGFENVFHGVCQGIAQDSKWFTYQTITYYVVLPKGPSLVQNIRCYVGPDCSTVP